LTLMMATRCAQVWCWARVFSTVLLSADPFPALTMVSLAESQVLACYIQGIVSPVCQLKSLISQPTVCQTLYSQTNPSKCILLADPDLVAHLWRLCDEQSQYHLHESVQGTEQKSQHERSRKMLILWFFLCGTGIRTRGLHLEPLHQPFCCDGFFQDRV
jgi:hypothetical protein